MEAEPALEFEFFLAAKLGRTIAELRAAMSSLEYTWWSVYFAREAQNRELAWLAGGGGK